MPVFGSLCNETYLLQRIDRYKPAFLGRLLSIFVKHSMDFHLNGGLSPTNKGISAHTGMPFLIEREPQGYFLHLPKIFYGLKIYEMKTEKIIRLRVSLSLEFKAPELVKVKAYQRIRNGKVEKVRSHYRIVVGR